MEWKTRFLILTVVFGIQAVMALRLIEKLEMELDRREREIIRLKKAPYYRRAGTFLKNRKKRRYIRS